MLASGDDSGDQAGYHVDQHKLIVDLNPTLTVPRLAQAVTLVVTNCGMLLPVVHPLPLGPVRIDHHFLRGRLLDLRLGLAVI